MGLGKAVDTLFADEYHRHAAPADLVELAVGTGRAGDVEVAEGHVVVMEETPCLLAVAASGCGEHDHVVSRAQLTGADIAAGAGAEKIPRDGGQGDDDEQAEQVHGGFSPDRACPMDPIVAIWCHCCQKFH